MNTVSLTAADAVKKTNDQLSKAMVSFDRWATSNPEALTLDNIEFRKRKQEIKLLRLKINELTEMKNVYQNTLLMAPRPEPLDMIHSEEFVKSRNAVIFDAKDSIRLGERKGNKVSEG